MPEPFTDDAARLMAAIEQVEAHDVDGMDELDAFIRGVCNPDALLAVIESRIDSAVRETGSPSFTGQGTMLVRAISLDAFLIGVMFERGRHA